MACACVVGVPITYLQWFFRHGQWLSAWVWCGKQSALQVHVTDPETVQIWLKPTGATVPM